MMKAFGFAVVSALVLAGVSPAMAQFKSQLENEPPVTDAITRQQESTFLFGWFDPSKFSMHHSVSFSYQTMGGQGMSVGMYTNSMMYQFAENLNARADVSLMYSPFSSLGVAGGKKNDLSSVYLSRAEVNYRPWENVLFQVQYRQIPWGSLYGSPFGPW
jgi:hypothetical protein